MEARKVRVNCRCGLPAVDTARPKQDLSVSELQAQAVG